MRALGHSHTSAQFAAPLRPRRAAAGALGKPSESPRTALASYGRTTLLRAAAVRGGVTATAAARPATTSNSRTSHASTAAASMAPNAGMSVAIVGAGFAGICMGVQLKKAGFTDFTLFEAADDVGGTWRENVYPGCRCDVASVLYSYSWEPWPWPEHYSRQPEILRYLHHVVDKYGLGSHLRLRTRVTGAVFDEAAGSWTVTTSEGEPLVVRLLVMAQGGLSVPRLPDIPGLHSFPGPVVHSAKWDGFDASGKRVGVIGTGASAIQIVPQLQPLAKELTVFQRTPPYVLPRSMAIPKWAKPPAKTSRLAAWLQRVRAFALNELLLGLPLIHNKTKQLTMMEDIARQHREKQVADEELRRKLTPAYSIGCKRVLPSDDFYPALTQPNTRLVASGLKEVRGSTLVAEDGTTADVDALVFATGFDLTATLGNMAIKGLKGADLVAEMPASLLGLGHASFPNLYFVVGPNTGLGSNSIVFMIECAVTAIISLARRIQDERLAWIAPAPAAQAAFGKEVAARLKRSVWLAGGCKSWYQDGRGSSAVLWPGLCTEYWWRTSHLAAREWVAAPLRAAGSEEGAAAAAAVEEKE